MVLRLVLCGSAQRVSRLRIAPATTVLSLLVPDDRLLLAERVGLELRRHGLLKHVEHLRRYYLTVRSARSPAPGEWTEAMVVEWAMILRLPPHEGAYSVRPRMSKCRCPSPKTYTQMVWPGGCKSACGNCHDVWLELG
jgi:hypothetical protein